MWILLFPWLLACGFGLSPSVPPSDDDSDSTGPAWNLCGAVEGQRGEGSWTDPVGIDAFPFTDEGDTSLSETVDAEEWACGSGAPQGGPEVVYRVRVPAGARVQAQVDSVGGAVHSLRVTPSRPADGAVAECTGPDGALDTQQLGEGTWYVVVDTPTPDGQGMPGAFRLRLDLTVEGEWQVRSLGEGLNWSRWTGVDDSGRQALHLLEVDVARNRSRPRAHESCESVPSMGAAWSARVAVALGARDGQSCEQTSFLRADGLTRRVNNEADPALAVGWNDGEDARTRGLALGEDWTEVLNGFAGFPQVIAAGALAITPSGDDPLDTERSARTLAGVNRRGELILLTADGPHAGAEGLTLEEASQALLQAGATEGVSLGGGASVTTWVAGCGTDGTVNMPLEGGGTPSGARGVPAGLYIF